MSRTLFLAAVVAGALHSAPDDGFVSLFDGKTLNGWEICNGFATYSVDGTTIVGRTAEGSPNSFLCTKKEYGDFVLEFETKTDPLLNSGVQVRSHRYGSEQDVRIFNGKEYIQRKMPAGRVHGYQVEVANEKSGTSGGIYDEARRGWLHNIASDPAARTAFKDNQWNRYRIIARGDSIKVFVNDVPCADIVDPLDQAGFIALQVHQFKGEKPAEVRWRNIRIREEGRHFWKRISNGTDLEGWKPTGGGAWAVEGGAIHGRSLPEDPRLGYLLSDYECGDCTIRLKFRIPKGNSGVFVRTDPGSMAAYEVEVDAQKRTGGLWEVRGRNWVTGPEDNTLVRADDWNDLTASVHGPRIVFHLNGVKTVDLPNDTQGRKEGHIALQAHGSKNPTEVWFKDIEVLTPMK